MYGEAIQEMTDERVFHYKNDGLGESNGTLLSTLNIAGKMPLYALCP